MSEFEPLFKNSTLDETQQKDFMSSLTDTLKTFGSIQTKFNTGDLVLQVPNGWAVVNYTAKDGKNIEISYIEKSLPVDMYNKDGIKTGDSYPTLFTQEEAAILGYSKPEFVSSTKTLYVVQKADMSYNVVTYPPRLKAGESLVRSFDAKTKDSIRPQRRKTKITLSLDDSEEKTVMESLIDNIEQMGIEVHRETYDEQLAKQVKKSEGTAHQDNPEPRAKDIY